MENPQVSLFASSIRPAMYYALIKSLLKTSVSVEIVFAGPCEFGRIIQTIGDLLDHVGTNVSFNYIETANIKPAQCYEVARRNCKGEVVIYIADDCEFPNDIIGKAYQYWKSQDNHKLLLSIQTKESGYACPIPVLNDMKQHRLFGSLGSSPVMAPIGLMSRDYLQLLGGTDRRYVCGQYENDIAMRVLADGGSIEIFGDENNFVEIDHIGKSLAIGEIKTEIGFLNRPFARGYEHDRTILENSWTAGQGQMLYEKDLVNGEKRLKRRDKFEPYEEKDIETINQSYAGIWSEHANKT